MNKKYSIGFFVGTIVLIALFAFAYRVSYNYTQEKHQAKMEEKQVQGEVAICYYILEKDGYVTVYESDKVTVYEYTTIPVDSLPEDVQTKIKKGIKVTSLGQVYGFLENYSS